MKKIKILIICLLIILASVITALLFLDSTNELKTIKSDKQLLQICNNETSGFKETLINIICMPFSITNNMYKIADASVIDVNDYSNTSSTTDSISKGDSISSSSISKAESATSSSGSKDYSTTNIQVENVDEADITKTDGDYIYSISDNNVIITDVTNPQGIKIVTTIKSANGSVPEDLILYDDTLVIISSKSSSYSSRYYTNSTSNTLVQVYNISNKNKPTLQKKYELYEPYYTSRRISNILYVISCGNLRQENDNIIRSYNEDNSEREIALSDIKYLKDVNTTKQTLISVVDLNEPKNDIDVSSYLIDISNAYVSENSIYLLNQRYDSSAIPISTLFGLKGVFGPFTYDFNPGGSFTHIYKFDICKNGEVKYHTKNKIEGKTINQYSLDEKNNHLRIALHHNDGTRVAILDEDLNVIGESEYLAKGERMYSSRFIGDKAYLVTYQTTDPLWVIDLSNEKNPNVLGELSIPGYSTYLHPYDDNHLIGIGMETEEVINKNANGKVISTTSKIIGMKMALFDVSDVNNPTQLSETIIGDRRTTSAILTNPKALLFSAKKGIIAIPVNNYSKDFEVDSSNNTYSSILNSYKNTSKSYISEGYLVYNINLLDGFNLKGIITHDVSTKNHYSNTSKLLRGLYIDDNLYTVSETAIKVNNLDTLDLINELKIKK